MATETHLPSSRETIGMLVLLGLSVIARIVCVLYGVIALVGFLYFGSLSPGMLAGFLAFVAAVIPASRPDSTDQRSTSILTLSVLGLACQVADVIAYYWLHNIPGNYYPWPESIAAFFALALMALHGAVTRTRQQHVV